MGAAQSYEKASVNNPQLSNTIDDLNSILKNDTNPNPNPNPNPTCNTLDSTSWCHDDNLNKYSILKLWEKAGVDGSGDTEISKLSNNLEKIKASMDMYLLYDNYNLKNNVIIKDLEKKIRNQNGDVKTDEEKIYKLKFNINNLKENIEKNKNIKLYLLIVIILTLLLIIIVSVFLYFKYKV